MCERYNVIAKRKNTREWSDWVKTNEYGKATEQLEKIEELGFDGKLKPSAAVKSLWAILGKDQTELTDKILDEGFCLRDEVVKETLVKVKMAIRKKQVVVKKKKYVSIVDLYDVMDNIIYGGGGSLEDEIQEQEDNA